MQLRFRPAALKDLEDIYAFIADDHPGRAGEFIDLIEEKCSHLVKHPLVGRLRPELRKDLRSGPVQRYLIFYRVLKNVVEVVHVLHGARDLRRFSETVKQNAQFCSKVTGLMGEKFVRSKGNGHHYFVHTTISLPALLNVCTINNEN